MLNFIDERPYMGEQLYSKLIASFDKFLGVFGCTDPRRSARQNDCTHRQRGSLGEEADQLRNAEDQISSNPKLVFLSVIQN